MNMARPVMIMAGGTGGHVYPALAVARNLLERGVPVIWMGTRRGLEARVIPAADIPMEWLSVSGLRGKGLLSWLLAPLRLNVALTQAFLILWRCRPRAVLGMGGFAAGPGGVMAFILGIPLVIHEQNAIAGLTNRLLGPLSTRLLEGFPNTFARSRGTFAGNPVRTEIATIPEPARRLGNRRGPLRLFVFGGSLGAQAFNETVPHALALLPEGQRPQVRHQAGRGKYEDAVRAYGELGVKAEVTPFVEDMRAAYEWSDLVLCRSGAITVAELAAAGCGSLLVPYPHAVDDHQTANARFLTAAGAGEVIPQDQLTPERLAQRLGDLASARECLIEMAVAARRLARPRATQTVAEICIEVAGKQPGEAGA